MEPVACYIITIIIYNCPSAEGRANRPTPRTPRRAESRTNVGFNKRLQVDYKCMRDAYARVFCKFFSPSRKPVRLHYACYCHSFRASWAMRRAHVLKVLNFNVCTAAAVRVCDRHVHYYERLSEEAHSLSRTTVVLNIFI